MQRSIEQYVSQNSNLEENYFARYSNLIVDNGENSHALGDLNEDPINQNSQNVQISLPILSSPERLDSQDDIDI